MFWINDTPYRERHEANIEGENVLVNINTWKHQRGYEVAVHGYYDDHDVIRVKGLRLDQARALSSKLARTRRRVWATPRGRRWRTGCVLYDWHHTTEKAP